MPRAPISIAGHVTATRDREADADLETHPPSVLLPNIPEVCYQLTDRVRACQPRKCLEVFTKERLVGIDGSEQVVDDGRAGRAALWSESFLLWAIRRRANLHVLLLRPWRPTSGGCAL